MGPQTAALPKPMIPLAGRPIVEHQILLARRYGIDRILMLTGYRGDAIEAWFGDGSPWGVRIDYVREDVPRGTAGAVRAVAELLDEAYFVFYGDVMMELDLGAMWRFHPKPREPGASLPNLVSAALYVGTRELVESIPDTTSRDFGREVFPALVREGRLLRAWRTAEYITDVGTPGRLAKVEAEIVSGKVARCHLAHPRPAVFLDRDGVLNREVDHVRSAEQLELLPGVADALRRLRDSEALAVVVTNQPGIAKGFFSEADLDAIHARLETLLGAEHAFVDHIEYCPHHPEAGWPGERAELKVLCSCRKPAPGMVLRAADRLHIDLSRSCLIGDQLRDIRCARAAGVLPIAVRTGWFARESWGEELPEHVFDDLASAVEFAMAEVLPDGVVDSRAPDRDPPS